MTTARVSNTISRDIYIWYSNQGRWDDEPAPQPSALSNGRLGSVSLFGLGNNV